MPGIMHVTLNSGDRTLVPATMRDADGVAAAAQLIDRTFARGDRGAAQLAPPRVGYALGVERIGGALWATVLGMTADRTGLEPIAAFAVVPRTRDGREPWHRLVTMMGDGEPRHVPAAPWCGVVLLPAIERHDEALDWLAGFEQDVAWAWIER